MMTIHCIHTGSTGNCYLVEYEKNKFLMLDCGVAYSIIFDYMKKNKISPTNIKFCLISHLHGDHLENNKFINMFSIPTYFSKLDNKNEIQNGIRNNLINYCGMYDNVEFVPEEDKNIKIKPFVVPHDMYNFAYEITFKNGEKLVYITDFGNIKELPIFVDVIDYIMIECNYGVETVELHDNLISRRSKSDTGHCSNVDCLKYLQMQPKIKNSNILLLHRSNDNLNPEVDYKIFEDLECKTIYPIEIGKKYEYTKKTRVK